MHQVTYLICLGAMSVVLGLVEHFGDAGHVSLVHADVDQSCALVFRSVEESLEPSDKPWVLLVPRHISHRAEDGRHNQIGLLVRWLEAQCFSTNEWHEALVNVLVLPNFNRGDANFAVVVLSKQTTTVE